MSGIKQRQICPRRLEMVIERLVLAKESFAQGSAEWVMLDECQAKIQNLLLSLLGSPR